MKEITTLVSYESTYGQTCYVHLLIKNPSVTKGSYNYNAHSDIEYYGGVGYDDICLQYVEEVEPEVHTHYNGSDLFTEVEDWIFSGRAEEKIDAAIREELGYE